jgi:hypothetical protein
MGIACVIPITSMLILSLLCRGLLTKPVKSCLNLPYVCGVRSRASGQVRALGFVFGEFRHCGSYALQLITLRHLISVSSHVLL